MFNFHTMRITINIVYGRNSGVLNFNYFLNIQRQLIYYLIQNDELVFKQRD